MASVTVERRDHVVIVTLDRPPVNAVDGDAYVELRDAFTSFATDKDVRAAILTATGDRAFVAGADLQWASGPRPRGPEVPAPVVVDPARLARDAMWAITDCAVPVVGAINGPAIGAGLALAACCDILVAADDAWFATTEINVGLLGASAHLSMLVGRYKAREMFFLGERVPASELQRLGAIRAVVPRSELLDVAFDVARQLAAKSPIALRLAKEAMNRVDHLPLKDAYRIEQDYTARLQTFDDAAEARAALAEKRDPRWQWR